MMFYEVTDADLRRAYRGTLADAHKLAKCRRPYSGVMIEIVEFDHSKKGIELLLKSIFESFEHGHPWPVSRTGRGYLLSNRGGLRPVEQLPKDL